MIDANNKSNKQIDITAKESAIIEYFAQGQKQAISSPNLKLEYTSTSIRLSDNHAVLIGISKQVNKWQRKVLISNKSIYKSHLIKSLEVLNFIARKKSSHPEFAEYHYYQIPPGSKLNYTETIQLWRTWWHHKRYQVNVTNAPIALSIFSKGNWYPVQDLQPKQGNFILITAKGEISIEPEEYIVWIDRSVATIEPGSPRKSDDSLDLNSYHGVAPAFANRLSEPEEYIDLEAYLSTFNTEDSDDIDRIEGIYNIGELLRSGNLSDQLLSPETAANLDRISSVVVEPPVSVKPPVAKSPLTPVPSGSVDHNQASIKLKAMNVLVNYLQQGEQIVHTEVLKNAQGLEINRKVTTIVRGCPSWAIEEIKQITSTDI